VWRTRFGRGNGAVVSQATELIYLKRCQIKPQVSVAMNCRICSYICVLVNFTELRVSLKTFPVGIPCLFCPWGKHSFLELRISENQSCVNCSICVGTVRRYLRLLAKRPVFLFHVLSELRYHRWPFCEFLKQQNKYSKPLHKVSQTVRQVRWQTCIKSTLLSTSRHWYDATHS
jgi:hypothetical protein